jgi:ribonucleotide reductase class II
MTDIFEKVFSFPETAPTANPVFYRTYSRRFNGVRETPNEVFARTTRGLTKLGKLRPTEEALILKNQEELKALPSGRWLWVGGTEHVEQPKNFYSAYNCSSTSVVDWEAFGLLMNLAMQGCGTGAMLEPQFINQLPEIVNHTELDVVGDYGDVPKSQRQDETTRACAVDGFIHLTVGDSRNGWVKAYQTILELSSDTSYEGKVRVRVDVSHVRPEGEELKGFGGIANPYMLKAMFPKIVKILNGAVGRQLTDKECCLLIDEAAIVVVAGSIRRSAGLRQFTK